MATVLIGKIDEFQPDQEPFSVYVERFELYAAANSLADDKKVPLFLTVLGGKIYNLLHDLFAPSNPKDQSFAAKLKDHFEPEPLIIAKRFHFHRRDQGPEESIAQYLAELRRLVSRCKFEAYLDEALRDRLVCGLRSDAIQRRILTEPSPTLACVVEIAQGMEAACQDTQSLKQTDTAVCKIMPRPPVSAVVGSTPTGKPCYCCGKAGHTSQSCSHKNTTCYFCQKRGHLPRVCNSRKKAHWVERMSSPKWVEQVAGHIK